MPSDPPFPALVPSEIEICPKELQSFQVTRHVEAWTPTRLSALLGLASPSYRLALDNGTPACVRLFSTI